MVSELRLGGLGFKSFQVHMCPVCVMLLSLAFYFALFMNFHISTCNTGIGLNVRRLLYSFDTYVLAYSYIVVGPIVQQLKLLGQVVTEHIKPAVDIHDCYVGDRISKCFFMGT